MTSAKTYAKEKRELYNFVRDGQAVQCDYRTATEAREQNADLESHGLSSRWVKWPYLHLAGDSVCPTSPCTKCLPVELEEK